MKNCGACTRFERFVEGELDGVCKRYPPKVLLVGVEVQTHFPVVSADEGACGEFASRYTHIPQNHEIV